MKLLPNINKSVPEAADPALIKPVSDALEALDTALGAKPSTLTTTAKTIVPAINELQANHGLFLQDESVPYGNPIEVIKNKWTELPFNGVFSVRVSNGSEYAAFIQRYGSNQHGSVIIWGYSLSTPKYYRIDGGVWTSEVNL